VFDSKQTFFPCNFYPHFVVGVINSTL